MNIIWILLGILLGAIALIEGGLRYVGFGDPLLYRADPEIGYLLSPDQKVRRLNRRIWINQYSMRSEPITEKRPENTLRIFLIGDSIANGGWWTDQEETISTSIGQQLKDTRFDRVEVLNASANSWGPRNQLAYLKRYGLFESQVVILLLNTEDFYSGVPNSQVVGKDVNYPDRKPSFAIAELLQRSFDSPEPLPENQRIKEKDIVGGNLEAIEEIHRLCRANNAQLSIGITPLLEEVEQSSQAFQQRAKNRLSELAKVESIPLIDFLPLFKQVEPPNSIYRDRIHITPEGNRIVSQILSEEIEKMLE